MNPVNHNVEGGKLWCSTAALSSLTGFSTASVLGILKQEGAPDWYHPSWDIFTTVCEGAGIRLVELPYTGKLIDLKGHYLCIVDPGRGHYVVIDNGLLVDSGNHQPVPIGDTRFKDAEVRYCWEVL